MTPCISIIIPVYKVEEFLPRCLRSIEEQTMRQGLEVILVDDGSPDRCGQMCDDFARRHPGSVHVIHQQNAGQSAARNAALEIARGEYLLFLDSDDFLLEPACERTLELARSTGADIVCFEAMKLRSEELMATLAPLEREPEMLTDVAEAFRRLMYTWDLPASVCGKLFRRELFEGVRFPVGMLCEDTFVLPTLLVRAKGIYMLHERLYFYRQCPGSTLHVLGTTIVDDRLRAHEEIARVVREHVPALAAEMEQYLYNIRIRCLQEIVVMPNFRRHPCWKKHIHAFRRQLLRMLRAQPRGKFDAHMKRYALVMALCPDILHRRLRRYKTGRFANYIVAQSAR